MKKRKIIPDPVLMVLSILGIAAFQFYWLKQSYEREEKTLTIKSEATFRQTIQQLQVAKLKLTGITPGSLHNNKLTHFAGSDSNGNRISLRFSPEDEIISTVNVIRSKLEDSLKKNPEVKAGMIISLDNTSRYSHDSLNVDKKVTIRSQDRIIQLLYGVDSLQDSLRIKEIDTAYSIAMKQQKLNIPFSVQKLEKKDESADHAFNEVTVGFANPVTYKLQLGNTFPYLIKRITLPILFSLLLLAITILSFVLLYRNILKQRRLGELKNEFISNITHELKTPIATVGVAIEALKNFNAIDNPERTKEYLDISSNELQRLSLLVDKVLKLSMFEKKEMELKYETVNLKEVVDEVVASLKLQFGKYGAGVTVTQEGDSIIQGDRLHLLSVIFNLIDNALKYSKETPSIQIDVKEKENNVVLSVTDNGAGIAPEYKDKIFEKFFRIPHGDTHNAKGYGLGLSYAAQVIQKHHGTINVDSEPGRGTTFTIVLPKTTV
jgi:two-component system, OmpR family, phosphate regulon sensor histidine kinase PhoR